MGLSWQQGPLSLVAIGRFLVPDPLPRRLLYADPLRRRMRVRFGGKWIAESEDVLLLFEPRRYPVAYFPEADISRESLQLTEHTTKHEDLGLTSWYAVRVDEKSAPRGAWQHIELPAYASELKGRIAFAWPAMEAFYEEDERILGHAADSYHRIDIRQTSRSLVVRNGDRIVADTKRPVVLYESGFAPRWYVMRADIDESALGHIRDPPAEARGVQPGHIMASDGNPPVRRLQEAEEEQGEGALARPVFSRDREPGAGSPA